MKKNKTPKGLISGEEELTCKVFSIKATEALTDYYKYILGRELTAKELKFPASLVNILRSYAENCKNNNQTKGG